MASSPDQGNELSVLDGDDGSISPDSPQDFGRIDCTIRVFRSFAAWITHSPTPKKHGATISIFISFYIEYKHYVSVITHWGSINTA